MQCISHELGSSKIVGAQAALSTWLRASPGHAVLPRACFVMAGHGKGANYSQEISNEKVTSMKQHGAGHSLVSRVPPGHAPGPGLVSGSSKPGTVAHACNPSTQTVEAGGSKFKVSLAYSSELEVSLCYMRPSLKEESKKQTNNTRCAGILFPRLSSMQPNHPLGTEEQS